jgi:hypothetical protein
MTKKTALLLLLPIFVSAGIFLYLILQTFFTILVLMGTVYLNWGIQ